MTSSSFSIALFVNGLVFLLLGLLSMAGWERLAVRSHNKSMKQKAQLTSAADVFRLIILVALGSFMMYDAFHGSSAFSNLHGASLVFLIVAEVLGLATVGVLTLRGPRRAILRLQEQGYQMDPASHTDKRSVIRLGLLYLSLALLLAVSWLTVLTLAEYRW